MFSSVFAMFSKRFTFSQFHGKFIYISCRKLIIKDALSKRWKKQEKKLTELRHASLQPQAFTTHLSIPKIEQNSIDNFALRFDILFTVLNINFGRKSGPFFALSPLPFSSSKFANSSFTCENLIRTKIRSIEN